MDFDFDEDGWLIILIVLWVLILVSMFIWHYLEWGRKWGSMTTKQKYLIVCDYAIRKLVNTGSSQLSIIKGNAWIDVPFAEVLNWLEEEYKQTNAESEE